MVERRFHPSRRKLMRVFARAIPAGLLLRASRSPASDKMTRQQAEYQDTPSSIYSCATCTLFEPPKSCKVVEGDVSRDGWCKAYAPAD